LLKLKLGGDSEKTDNNNNNVHIQRCLSIFEGHWLQDTPLIEKSADAQVPYIKWHSICINLCTSSCILLIMYRLLLIPNTMGMLCK
jgi:hypothetical protein